MYEVHGILEKFGGVNFRQRKRLECENYSREMETRWDRRRMEY
jgi:hypothetical protein